MTGRLISLIGAAGSGKDEVAKILVAEFGFTRLAFADTLKHVARDIGWDGRKDEAGRRLLQDLGVAVRTYVDENAWVQPVWERAVMLLADDYNVVITDMRFHNEYLTFKHGQTWRIARPGVGPANDHVSENELAEVATDLTIVNNGTLFDLAKQVRRFVTSPDVTNPVTTLPAEGDTELAQTMMKTLIAYGAKWDKLPARGRR